MHIGPRRYLGLSDSPMQSQLTPAQIKAATSLASAIDSRSDIAVESAMAEAVDAGFHPVHEQSLIILADAPWHSRHEDVVLALQRLRCPAAVEVLEKTAHATHAYLEYDEDFALARKCTWALADIGTPTAHEALWRLAGSDNSLIAGYAQKRLDNWQKELPRKGRR